MSRPLRVEFDGAWYHVMNRGVGRRNIVRTDKDRQLFFKVLEEVISTFPIEVHAYALMDNHYHLLIHTPQSGLSRAMRHLNGVYTQRLHRHWKTDGPIFRGRYKAVVVDSDEYLLELVRYIHLNPVKAGLCTLSKKFLWSSHSAYLNKKHRPDWLTVEEVLLHFGRSEKKAAQALNAYVQEGVPKRFEKKLEMGTFILGSKGFAEWVYKNFVDQGKKGIALKQRKPKPKVPVKEVLDMVSHIYDLPLRDIRKAQSGQKNEARSMTAYLIRRLCSLSQKETAGWLNLSEANTVAQMQYRFVQRLKEDKTLNKKTETALHAILSTVKT